MYLLHYYRVLHTSFAVFIFKSKGNHIATYFRFVVSSTWLTLVEYYRERERGGEGGKKRGKRGRGGRGGRYQQEEERERSNRA